MKFTHFEGLDNLWKQLDNLFLLVSHSAVEERSSCIGCTGVGDGDAAADGRENLFYWLSGLSDDVEAAGGGENLPCWLHWLEQDSCHKFTTQVARQR